MGKSLSRLWELERAFLAPKRKASPGRGRAKGQAQGISRAFFLSPLEGRVVPLLSGT